jgi:hypothetical protein
VDGKWTVVNGGRCPVWSVGLREGSKVRDSTYSIERAVSGGYW